MTKVRGASPAAQAYARAFIELAVDDAQADSLGEELRDLTGMMRDDEMFRSFLLDPSLSIARRWETIKRTFGGRASELVVNLLGVLNEKGRFALLPEIDAAYQEMLDERLGRVRVQMTIAQKLDATQMAEVQQRVSAALGKTAIIEEKVDESIIGGIVLRVQDQVMDASVKAQLDAMRRQLLAARTTR